MIASIGNTCESILPLGWGVLLGVMDFCFNIFNAWCQTYVYIILIFISYRTRIDQIMNITCLILTLIEFFYSILVVVRLIRNVNT